MKDTSLKHFDSIHDDYAFFQKHSTEAKSDVEAYLPHLEEAAAMGGRLRLLDFGCGDGDVTAEILSRANISPDRLVLSLSEPDAGYLKAAHEKLGQFTAHPISASPELPPGTEAAFDFIISNNALYYVTDLHETLSALTRSLASPGIFISSVAGHDNALVQYTFPFFEMIKKPYPFWLAEECKQALEEIGKSVEVEEVRFELFFPDSEAGRLSMAHFLMGSDYLKIPKRALLEGFDKHLRDGNIFIETTNKHLIVRALR